VPVYSKPTIDIQGHSIIAQASGGATLRCLRNGRNTLSTGAKNIVHTRCRCKKKFKTNECALSVTLDVNLGDKERRRQVAIGGRKGKHTNK